MVKPREPTILPFWVAHILAWAGFLFLALWPNFYRGVEVSAALPGEPQAEGRATSASLIEVNGLGVLPLLLIPVIVTGLALLATVAERKWSANIGATVWVAALTLVFFAGVGLFSLGLFYAPAAIALLVAAVLRQRSRPRRRDTWR